MNNITLLLLGIAISAIGVMNMRGNISTVHSYNRRKVKEEDIPKYGKTIGAGTLIIGLSLVVSFFIKTYAKESLVSFVMIPALIIGLGIILYGQFKYNKGIF